jgi:hypothetical protein
VSKKNREKAAERRFKQFCAVMDTTVSRIREKLKSNPSHLTYGIPQCHGDYHLKCAEAALKKAIELHVAEGGTAPSVLIVVDEFVGGAE